MIYLIFTTEGFNEAKAIILEDEADLWVNDDVLSNAQRDELSAANINVNILPENANPKNEKSVLSALKHVEQQVPKTEIFVEYL
ncbi:hypothetical protein A9Q79_04875 [Methylophaga sp. 42_25_T18]|nr:hypothetical protein A9Q79_04875 [Methylophaga sp. 42_25_T18]OUR85740.1 hypothetical protein A9Q92_07520 [Methylophaga sp. 42_8_T64]